MRVRGVCECALKLPRVWEGCAAIILHITGCQPDSGKPTVRDERGACGNVGYGGTRHPPRISKERVLETLHLRSYAPHFYPTVNQARRDDLARHLMHAAGLFTGNGRRNLRNLGI